MVTASQLQLLQSPITALITSIPTSVNVKLDESNYLNWNFQMQLLLESNGIMGYVDGLLPCPPQHCSISAESAMVASTGDTYTQGSFSPNHGQSQVHTRQFQSYNGNRNRSKGRFPQGSRFFGPKPGFSSMAPMFPNSNSGVLGQSPAQPFRHPSALMVPICQLCNSEGHTAPFCGASPPKRTRCNICGRSNHPSWYCFYNDKGPNYMASYSLQSSFSMQPQPLQYTPYQASPS
ncbi:uncharacterized protein [Populus alba]|uniref:uncharacterized protein isoform X2 n=1 Tax=Populus alba TaxID=43335 RepID=UPI00158D5A4C|nr:uncharacterized protein LOC118061423 isoform X2 [Populus alba]